jgi:hypothetical protein
MAITTIFIQAGEFKSLATSSELIDIQPTTRESFRISEYKRSVEEIQRDLFPTNNFSIQELTVSKDFQVAKSSITDGLFTACSNGNGTKLSQSKVNKFVNNPAHSLKLFREKMFEFVQKIEMKVSIFF